MIIGLYEYTKFEPWSEVKIRACEFNILKKWMFMGLSNVNKCW